MTLLQQVSNFEHLYEAHMKSRNGKRNQKDVIEFELNLGMELAYLEQKLNSYEYRLGPYYKFKIKDPKERLIYALEYPDRVVQHSLCDNVLRPILEPKLIYDNSACRIGKGTHFAINRLSEFMRKQYRTHKEFYILKFDIKKYFDSIDHNILFRLLSKAIDDREIKGLLKMIITSYETNEGKGLPMGNQSSQWFALFYLNTLDHYIKEELHLKYYSRYMDDGVIIHHDREYLKQCLASMKEFIHNNLQLEFNDKTQIVPMKQGVDYLGFHFYMTDTGKVIKRLRTSNKKRLKRKLKHYKSAYKKDKIELDAITRSLSSYMGHLSHGHTYALRKNIIHNFSLSKENRTESRIENNTVNDTENIIDNRTKSQQ